MPSLRWRPNPFTLISFGILLADQVLDGVIEFAIPAGARRMLIPGWLGVIRPLVPVVQPWTPTFSLWC